MKTLVDKTSLVPRREDSKNVEIQIATLYTSRLSRRKSKSSKTSSHASERSRKAKAELLYHEVELKNLLKRQEMERQMDKMKIQEEELKRRFALLTTEGEMEKAKAVDQLYKTSEYLKHRIRMLLVYQTCLLKCRTVC